MLQFQDFNSGLNKQEGFPLGSSDVHRCGVPVEEELTPAQLVAQVQEHLHVKLGAIIDLTFTARYYNSKVWQFNANCVW